MAGAPSNAGVIDVLTGLVGALVLSQIQSQKMLPFLARANREDMTIIGDLIATGKVTPVIDRRYRLSEAAEALRYSEEGHARGKVVITI